MINKKGNIAIAISIIVAALIIGSAVIFTSGSDKSASENSDKSVATNDAPSKVNPVDEDDWVVGNRDAGVKIVEYSDTECSFCSVLHPTLKQISEEYSDQVAWVYRHFPLAQLHPIAPTVSAASECVGNLGGDDAFWGYINKIYDLSYENTNSDNPESLSAHAKDTSKLTDYAVEFGVNAEEFDQCLEEGRYEDDVREDYDNAVAAGGQGTPFNVIVLDEEMDDETQAAVEAIASEVNSADRTNMVISGDGRHISLAGAFPYDIWKGLLETILN